MASLKWLLNSAFMQVFGHMDTTTVHQNNNPGCVKKLKKTASITKEKEDYPYGFQMPLHYPRYNKADYEKMEEGRLDLLLNEYGLCLKGTLDEKRAFAMASFLWPGQL